MLSISEIGKYISEDTASSQKMRAREADRYYKGLHDILNLELFYYDANGALVRDKYKSNIRISHPFFTELVDQQVQYMLSGSAQRITSEIPELQATLDSYFNDEFWSEVNDLLKGTIVHGTGFLVGVSDDEGKTTFESADSLGVIEVRAKDTDDGCEYLIYHYPDRLTKENQMIERIQVWDKDNIYFYVKDGKGKIAPDESVPLNPRPHTLYTDAKGTRLGKGYGFIPFFRLDNGMERLSGLNAIKDIIDDYDLMACSLSNNLQDFTDAIYVVKGFSGDNLDELITNIKSKKHIGIEEGAGDLDIKTIDIPFEARVAKLELDEKNIYRFGMGFNSAQVGDGNVTNVVIKSRYALLDLKCNKLESRLKRLLQNVIQIVLDETNAIEGTDYTLKNVSVKFDREVITNAQDNAQIELVDAQKKQTQVTTLLNLQGILGDDTIIDGICKILELDVDEVRRNLPENPQLSLAGARDELG